MRKVIIYTDGSCLGNPGPGGWAATMFDGFTTRRYTGNNPHTTNNRMELEAVINVLKYTYHDDIIKLHTDSKYVINGITKWVIGWRQKQWKDVKNADLWKILDKLSNQLIIEYIFVKGHSNNKYNDLVDRLARDEANKIEETVDISTWNTI